MTANNGWPGKPGVPLNPEKDGWHWLKTGHGVAPWMWRDDPQSITWGMGWETNEEVFAPGDIARVPGTTYLGPCLTPDEATALQARADQAALGHAREADRADRSEFLHKRDVDALQARVAELEGALRNARARYIELSDKDAAEAMAEIINEALGDVK